MKHIKDKYHEYRSFITEESKQELITTLSRMLNPIEVDVFLHRSGLLYESSTLQVTGEKYGFSRERVRQIENKTLRKLRHPIRVPLIFNSVQR